MTDYDEKIYSIALSIISSPTLNCVWDLIPNCSPSETYGIISNRQEMRTQGYLTEAYPGNPLEAAAGIYERSVSKSIKVLDYWDSEYPPILREIPKPPIILYCKGDLNLCQSMAIVGTRQSDKKSAYISRRLSDELSNAGFTITSGMAIGIDREAHLGALQKNRPTIGVLANGIDVVYPLSNRDVYNAIVSSEKSCLISEYPPGILAGKWTFVRRNRIISGLSIGTVVVKAGNRSGALITARHALEQNREVFACPGLAFDEAYAGCNRLINNGAVPVSHTGDILNELEFINYKKAGSKKSSDKKVKADLPPPELQHEIKGKYEIDSLERTILEALSSGEMEINNIGRKLKCNVNKVNESIMTLELSGDICRDGNTVSRI